MSTVGVSVANTEFDAAQALLDLQSNIRGNRHENYEEKPSSDRTESVETAKLFLSCVIASNLTKPTNQTVPVPKVGTVGPIYAVAKNNLIQSDAATSMHTTKRKTPDPESPRDMRVSAYHCEESTNKRSKIFKRKPIKNFTVTAGPLPDIATNNLNNQSNGNNSTETGVKIRDVGTQTEEKYQLPIIETMELTITKLCEKIKSLEEQIKSYTQENKTVKHDTSNNEQHFEDNDDESYKANSNELTLDDSNAFDSDLVDTDYGTPEKDNKSKSKVRQFHGYNKTSKVLNNRNLNTNSGDVVPIGDGNAMIPSRIFRHINWNSYTSATRKLLTAVFSRRVLATHSLTGKPSPAFPNKPAKKKLDQALVNDIVQTVVERCCVPENVVRTSITTKCADESKMFRTRQQNKKKRKHKVNRENIPPDTDSDEF